MSYWSSLLVLENWEEDLVEHIHCSALLLFPRIEDHRSDDWMIYNKINPTLFVGLELMLFYESSSENAWGVESFKILSGDKNTNISCKYFLIWDKITSFSLEIIPYVWPISAELLSLDLARAIQVSCSKEIREHLITKTIMLRWDDPIITSVVG